MAKTKATVGVILMKPETSAATGEMPVEKILPVVRSGGRYVVDPATGERKRVEEPTQPHPEGAGARHADGTPVAPHGSDGQ